MPSGLRTITSLAVAVEAVVEAVAELLQAAAAGLQVCQVVVVVAGQAIFQALEAQEALRTVWPEDLAHPVTAAR